MMIIAIIIIIIIIIIIAPWASSPYPLSPVRGGFPVSEFECRESCWDL